MKASEVQQDPEASLRLHPFKDRWPDIEKMEGQESIKDTFGVELCKQAAIAKLIELNLAWYDRSARQLKLSGALLQKTFGESLGFEDVAIRQKKNKLGSRLDANIVSEVIRGVQRPIPLVATNMSTVVDANFIIELYKLGALGILHRAADEETLASETRKIAAKCQDVAVSVGVGESQLALAQKLIRAGATIVCIDVAQGYADYVIDFGRSLKKFSTKTAVVIGNSVNEDIVPEIADFADGLRVGIAQGFACETKNTAGCTEKQFSALLRFRTFSKKYGLPIISDGGTREPADFVKAIAAGASSVWAGKIFAACPESAAEVVKIDGVEKKLYAGMASRYVQEKWKGGIKPGTCPEGGIRYLDIGEPVGKLLERYAGALKSGLTYAGAANLVEFQDTAEFIKLYSCEKRQ